MRVVLPTVLLLALIGCDVPSGPDASAPDASAECAAQGHAPGSEAWRLCMDAGGAAIATGPGSPFANVDEEEEGD